MIHLRVPRWPWRQLATRASLIGCALLVLTCAFGIFAISRVGGVWRNALEAKRIVRSYSPR